MQLYQTFLNNPNRSLTWASIIEGMNLRDMMISTLSRSVRYDPQGILLSSGRNSRYFVDVRKALSHWGYLYMACHALDNVLQDYDCPSFDAVGGMSTGADHIAIGMAALRNTRWFSVRKEPKTHGTSRWTEGARIGKNWDVLIVDDVVTSGKSMYEASRVAELEGANVVGMACIVDRRGGRTPDLDIVSVCKGIELGIPIEG